ncbi:MAG: hypothetical protein K6U80_09615 [Firmicutes bacterium]|nr:hypothetical protein [Bacillota bacterium]
MKCKILFWFIFLWFLWLGIYTTGYSFIPSRNTLDVKVEGASYVLEYSYTTKCPKDLLISILYDFDHLTRIATLAKTIKLVDQGPNWYIVQYEYAYLGYHNRLSYLTTLEPDDNIVRYELIDFWQNIKLLPVPVSAKGYWKVIEGPEFNTIYDSQENIFEKPLSALAKLIMPKETMSYAARLEKYIEEAAKAREATDEPAPDPTAPEMAPAISSIGQ